MRDLSDPGYDRQQRCEGPGTCQPQCSSEYCGPLLDAAGAISLGTTGGSQRRLPAVAGCLSRQRTGPGTSETNPAFLDFALEIGAGRCNRLKGPANRESVTHWPFRRSPQPCTFDDIRVGVLSGSSRWGSCCLYMGSLRGNGNSLGPGNATPDGTMARQG